MLLNGPKRPQDIDPKADPKFNITKLNDNLRSLFQFIETLSNPEQSPVLQNANLLDLDRSRLVDTNRKGKLRSVRDFTEYVSGKKNQIVVKDNGRGGVQLSLSSAFIEGIGGSNLILDTGEYDEIEFTFTGGFLTGVTYKLAAAIVESVAITWNSYDQPETITSSVGGKTMTISYLPTGFPEEAIIT